MIYLQMVYLADVWKVCRKERVGLAQGLRSFVFSALQGTFFTHFFREKGTAHFPLVDSRRILNTTRQALSAVDLVQNKRCAASDRQSMATPIDTDV